MAVFDGDDAEIIKAIENTEMFMEVEKEFKLRMPKQNKDNEIAAWSLIMDTSQHYLGLYPNTIDEDI